MKLCRSRIAIAILFSAVLASGGGAQAIEGNPRPFSPGETLTYDINWSVFPAGKLTASLSRSKHGLHDAYVIKTTADSQGFASLLYKVQDKFQSIFDPRTLCSIEIFKQINEGAHHRITKIAFDRYRGLAILDERYLGDENKPPKHEEQAIPPCALDIVTAFYYVRSQPLHVGGRIKLEINDGSKTKTVVAEVTGRKKIKTPLGEHEALRVVPSVFGNLYEQKKGKIVIWFSNDAYHFPLRIRVSLKLGAITGTLISVSPLPQGYAATDKSDVEIKSAGSASAIK